MKKLLTFLTLLTLFFATGWAADVTDVLNQTWTGVTGTNYTTWSGKTATSNAVYAGNSAGGNSSIQLRSDKSTSGIVTTASGGKVKSITVVWNSNTASGRTLDIYGKNTAYSAASDLYTVSTQGTLLGSIKYGESTSLTVSGDYEYIGLRSYNGAMYLTSISIVWEEEGSTEPDPISPSGTITFNPAAGAVTSGTTVEMSFSGTCDGIKYTTDGTSPSATNGTVYDASNKPAITAATTITAAAYNYSNSKYAFGTEATAEYTLTIPSVDYDGTATFNATVDAGTSPLIKQPVTFACSNGVLDNRSEYRLYKNSTTTFTVPTGYKIVKIEFTCTASGSAQYGPGSFASQTGYSYDGNIGTWVGNAESVSFTASNNQVRCSLINVYYTGDVVEDIDYYLVGTFNMNGTTWVQGDAAYKFTENNGVYELNNVDIPDETEFKIIKVQNGTTTWWGGNGGGSHYDIHSGHHTNINLGTGNNYNNTGVNYNDNFYLQPGAITSFSFTVDNDNNPSVLNVNRDAQMFIKGDFTDNWKRVAMNATSTGWTLNQEIAANNQFGFVDEWGQWRGCANNQDNITLTDNDLNTNLALWTDGKNFVMANAGDYKLDISSDKNTLIITTAPVAHNVVCTVTPEGYGTITANPTSALPGATVNLTVSPTNNNYELVSVSVNGEEIEDNNGEYSFTMPALTANVVATFAKKQYTITKVENHGTIAFTDGVTENEGTVTAGAGDVVKFTVTPQSDKYVVSSVTVSWPDGSTTTPTLENGVYSFTMQGRNATVTATCVRQAVGDGSFVLVTDASTLKAGDKVIITNSGIAGSALAMAEDRGNNRGSVTVTITSDLKITPNAILPAEGGVQVLTLESATATVNGQTTNAWMFNTGGQYLYAASSGSNYLKTASADVAGENGKATITIGNSNNNYNAVITFRGSNTRNIIRNNGSLFACYSSGQSPVYIYKQTAAGLMVEIDPDGGEVIGSQDVTIDANVEGAMVQYKIGDGEWSTLAEAPVTTTITGNVGDQVVVYAKATMEDDGETLEDETSSTFTFVAPAAPTITPASCNISSETQNVTITSSYDNGTIEYSTDGGTTWNTYTGQFQVIVEGIGESVTVQARVTYNGVTSETASATYTRGVQPVVFSPAKGTYYGDQTCQMFSTTKGARIYYTMTDDGSEPADPEMNTAGTQLYTGEIEMTHGNTYNFKAVAYIGTTPSEISSVNYTIKNTSEYVSPSQYNNPKLYSVAELNAVNVPLTNPYYTTDYYEMVNPVQVIYMSTYKQNGYQPEFCLIRDNTGYGMIYFGKQNSAHNNFKVFEMGDWIGGGYSGQVSNFYDPNQQVLSDTHPELGRSGSGQHIFNWVTSAMSNSAVLPEYLTISEIQSSGTDDNPDYWGHYVHLRKNTVELIQSTDPGDYTTGQDKDGKWSGTITDEDGQSIMYYDKFYLQCNEGWTLNNNLFTGHPNRTFDVYGFVACYKNVYQISPFDFAWIDMPICDHVTETYTEEQTVSLSSPDDPTATIWYKTSEMDDFHVYTEPFTVNSTTTVEWYATKQSQYNDELESKRGTITMTFEEIAKPVISPESQVKAVGESVDASIAYEEGKTVPPIAVILYTTDGSDPKTSETAQEYTIGTTTLHFTTTTTVRAITRVGNLYSAEADAKTYTFVKSNGIEYTLIDDATKLKENGVYVIVSQNYSEAISTTQNVNNRGAAGVLFVEGTNKAKVYGNDDVAQFTLSVLTHDEDTSPERHFLMQTNNSNVNGYLYVGHDVNNSLMTEAEEDAMGNDVAVITIDSDGRAHIHFNYAGGDNRYLQYWNRDRLFNTYKTEYDDRAVYIYGVEATPLATIEKEGVTTEGMNQYTIADELVVVWANADEGKLWCKDQGNVSIAKTEIKDGQVDYMKEVGQQHGEWDQSNWVVLQFPKPTMPENDPIKTLLNNAVGKYIEPATVTGYYIDDNNYTIQMAQAENYTLALKEGADTTKNVYCTANFLPDNLNINGQNGAAGIYHGDNRNYFFMNPKIQEVCSITFAEWTGDNTFVVPVNDAQINGSFKVDWTYNAEGPQSPASNTAYRFVAAVQRPQGSTYLKADQEYPIIVYPLDFTAESALPTAINTVEVGNGEIKSIKYVNVAGIVSDRPFQGVNIVVTEYTDGSRTTTKMLHK